MSQFIFHSVKYSIPDGRLTAIDIFSEEVPDIGDDEPLASFKIKKCRNTSHGDGDSDPDADWVAAPDLTDGKVPLKTSCCPRLRPRGLHDYTGIW